VRKTLIISGIACIVVGVALLAVFLVLGFSGLDDEPVGGEMDRHFIEEMIPHQEDAVAMADLALSRAEHP